MPVTTSGTSGARPPRLEPSARAGLPGGTSLDELQGALRRTLDRPRLVVDDVDVAPIPHPITAPSTASLSRVRVIAHDDAPVELRLVAKVLQSALHGLPAAVPLADRQRIAAGIPWRLEWEVYTSDTAARMPPGLRLPRVFGVTHDVDDQLTLWLEDVDAVEGPWTATELAAAATALGRMGVRRADQVLRTQPDTGFLPHLVENALRRWAVPALRSDALWDCPAFRQPEVAALRVDLLALADDVEELYAGLARVPWTQTHGDPTPMNLLRPRDDPDTMVLIDWGTATPGPVGWDLVPLVFGPAENGAADPDDLPERLAVTVPAFVAGLAEEGSTVAPGVVADAVRRCALVRYPFTSLPIGEALTGQPVREDLDRYAVRKAAFVRAVLDACRQPA